MQNEKNGNSPAVRREIATILAGAKLRLFEQKRKSDNTTQSTGNQLDKARKDGIV